MPPCPRRRVASWVAHLGYGCLVRTTAEVLIAVLPEWKLSREHDAASGYKELTISRRSDRDVER